MKRKVPYAIANYEELVNENCFYIDKTKFLEKRNPNIEYTTERKEKDKPEIVSGIFNNFTTGAPLTILFKNNDCDSSAYENIKDLARPSHADFVAHKKYKGFNDYRGGGHFSGRLTLAIVSAGVIAKKIITEKKQNILAKAEVFYDKTKLKEADSLGAKITCTINNVPIGLGEPFFESFESKLSYLLFSVPGVKGVEFGEGFNCVDMIGSEYNDEIISIDGKTKTNNSGGINAGITNGNDIMFSVAIRSTASIFKTQNTINLKTGKQEEITIKGRHDKCFALRCPVIIEACAYITVLDFLMETN